MICLALEVSWWWNALASFLYCSVFCLLGHDFFYQFTLVWLIQTHPELYVWSKPLISQCFCSTLYIQLRTSEGCEIKQILALKLKVHLQTKVWWYLKNKWIHITKKEEEKKHTKNITLIYLVWCTDK